MPREPRALGRLAVLLVGWLAGPGSAWAQPSGAVVAVEPLESDEATGAPVERGLKARFGVPHAEALLLSDDPRTRVRGVERLGAIGTDEAVEALAAALEIGTRLSRDQEARLVAVRALAPHAGKEAVRELLARELAELPKARQSGTSDMAELLRGTAALALARSRDPEALLALLSAVRQGGAAAAAATQALRAYPPRSLEPILTGRATKKAAKKGTKAKNVHRALAPSVVELLGELGDLRAIPHLRKTLERRDQASQLAAARALARLGDPSALPLADAWIKRPDAELQKTATEVYAEVGSPKTPRAIATLLSGEGTRRAGLELALMWPSPALGKVLGEIVPKLAADQRPLALAALGRAGGARARAALVTALDDPALALPAAHALATMADEAAGAELAGALARAMAKPAGDPSRARTAYAGVVRALVVDDDVDGLSDALRALAKSAVAAEREAGTFGLVALGVWSAEDVLATGAPALAWAAARAALARGDELDAFRAPLLASAVAAEPPDPRSVVAFSIALLAEPRGRGLSSPVLTRWVEEGGPAAPLAARARAARSDTLSDEELDRLFSGTDPVVRAHVALGLGLASPGDAASVLAHAYRFETEAPVRRAAVRALSVRPEPQRVAALELARDLDPDPEVRAIARSALLGHRVDVAAAPGSASRWIAWVALVSGDAAGAVTHRSARVVRPDGLALPVVSAADGSLLVPSVGPGAGALSLAPPVGLGEPPSP